MKEKCWFLWVVAIFVALFAFRTDCHAATVEWDAVTAYMDGTPITGQVTYQVYTGGSSTGPWVASGGRTTALSVTAPDPAAGGTMWYTADACVETNCSEKGVPASKVVPFPPPVAPLGIRVK